MNIREKMVNLNKKELLRIIDNIEYDFCNYCNIQPQNECLTCKEGLSNTEVYDDEF